MKLYNISFFLLRYLYVKGKQRELIDEKKWERVIGILVYLHYFSYAVIVTVSFIDRG
jgi:hypothetical protein